MRFLIHVALFLTTCCQLTPNNLSLDSIDPILVQFIHKCESRLLQKAVLQSLNVLIRNKKLSRRNLHDTGSVLYISMLLLALSNDIETNPGPAINNSTTYLCGTCDLPVTWDHRAIVCDSCDQWYHISCQDIHSGTYNSLAEDENIRWDCLICNNPNYTTVCYDLYHSTTDNFFSVLSVSDSSLPSPNDCGSLKPIHSSTPERKHSSRSNCKQPPLRILSINCQSMRKKQERLENIIFSTKPDIIMATETWLDPTITDSQVLPPTYTAWRKDRTTGKGGGVLIAIKNTLVSQDIPEFDVECEIIWAKISIIGCKTLYICSFYNPKTSDREALTCFEESVHRASNIKDAVLFISGDFNLPGWNWKTKSMKPNTPYSDNHQLLINIINDNGMSQLVEEPTRNQSTLDLIITNSPSKVNRIDVIPGISDHDAIYCEINMNPVKLQQKERNIPLFKKANWEGFRQDLVKLLHTIKNMASLNCDVNDMWRNFTEAIQSSTREHIPTKATRPKDKLPWINKEIKQLLKKRDRLYKRKRKSNSVEDTKKFKKVKQLVQLKMRRAYWDYIESIISIDKSENPSKEPNIKRFWTYIKHKKKDNANIPGIKDHGKLFTEPRDKAKLLNKQFQSVFTTSDSVSKEEFKHNSYMKSTPSKSAGNITITCRGVQKLLEGLNPHKAPGPDNISPRILRELSKDIAPILTLIFKRSYDSGTIPDQWKQATVHPVFKKGSKYDAANYRPISLTCISCKLMEHIITSHIMNHAENNNILNPTQHGFRKRRSCETQLLEFTNDISQNLENGQQTDILVMDFAKAFDKVSHNLLIHKLDHYGIRGKTNRWIKAFLSDRTQTVVTEGESSDKARVISGVPQGSVLGPSLFLYYINDICDEMTSTIRLFADDTIAYLTVKNETDAETLQQDLDRLATWEERWKMRFHPSKCEVLTVSRKHRPVIYQYKLHNHILRHVSSTKYLGCTINSTLDWGQHIDNITTKANRTLGFLRRNLNISSITTKETAFLTMVRPSIEYASCVWDPYETGDINNLEMIQRRGARFVKHSYHNRSSVSDMIEELNWRPLQERRKQARLTMFYKIIHQEVAIRKDPLLKPPHRTSRSSNPLCFAVPYASTLSRQKSFLPRTIRDWNQLPESIMSADSVETFQARLVTHSI